MDKGAAIFGATLFAAIAGLSSVASIKTGNADTSGAVAQALKEHFRAWVGSEGLEKGNANLPEFTLCLESEVALDIDAIVSKLSETVIRPSPVGDCTSETVEGDFGMFSAMTTYYDSSGQQAAHVEIARVHCATSTSCLVDIDDFGAGMSYLMRRNGREWRMVEHRLRWIV